MLVGIRRRLNASNHLVRQFQSASSLHHGVSESDTSLTSDLWPSHSVVSSGAAPELVDAAQGHPVGDTVSLIDAFHSATGLPWWATLCLTALGVRAALLPLAVRQVQASSGLAKLLQQVRSTQPSGDAAPAGKDRIQQTLQKVAALRRQHSIPHPAWILAAPVAQIPFFVTAVMAVRRMSATAWPGFDTGGLLWFSDLCQPALNLGTVTAPLGPLGAALPAGVALVMFVNIQRGFAVDPQGTSVLQWVMRNVKLLMEWVTVPILVIALQLPQGAVLYWLASSLSALAQGHILQVPSLRAKLGLPSAPASANAPKTPAGNTPQQQAAFQQTAEGNSIGQQATIKGPKGSQLGQPIDMAKLLEVSPQIKELAASMTDANSALLKAAELRAEGSIGASQHCLQRAVQLQPTLAPAHFALGQNHAALRQWPLAEQAFLRAADLHQDSHQQARCWFGAGIAQQMQAEHDAALQSLDTANALCLHGLQQSALQQQPQKHDEAGSAGSVISDPQRDAVPNEAGDMLQAKAPTAHQQALDGRNHEEPKLHAKALSATQQADVTGKGTANAAQGLAVKALLAKASILKQLERTSEANECMNAAKQLDPDVSKRIKNV